MSVGIVICSTCDLPEPLIQENNIDIIPSVVKVGDNIFHDRRNVEDTQVFYREFTNDHKQHITTQAYTKDQLIDWALNEIVLKYNHVIFLTVSSEHSPLYEHLNKAIYKIKAAYKKARDEFDDKGRFTAQVINTNNSATGEAVFAYEAIQTLKRGDLTHAQLRVYLNELREVTYSFFVLDDLYYLRNIGNEKSDLPVGSFIYSVTQALNLKPIISFNNGVSEVVDKVKGFDSAMKKMFAHVTYLIKQGLRVPVIFMSYAGDLNEISKKEVYQDFIKFCDFNDIQCTLSLMSSTVAMNIGPGAFSLGLIVNKKTINEK